MQKQHKLSAVEFSRIVRDVLKQDKNICLHKNFEKLDYLYWFPKPKVFPNIMPEARRGKRMKDMYFDVWLVDPFGPFNSDISSKTSVQFMLQLACIVSRTKKWEGVKLRVLVHIDNRARIENLLTNIRIPALIKVVAFELPSDVNEPQLNERRSCYDVSTMSDEYVAYVNRRILEESGSTVVTFLHLRPPPYGKESEHFQMLNKLSKDIPPCLYVHGVSAVISTSI